MRHYWSIIRTANLASRSKAESIIQNHLPTVLSIKPDEVAIEIYNETDIVVSVFANAESLGYSKPFSINKTSALLVSGLPTLERFGVSPQADIPISLVEILANNNHQDVFHKVGGQWSIGYLNPKGITVFADFSGYSSCFYCTSDEFIVVGNHSKLVSLFNGLSGRANLNWKSLSWIASTTMILGNKTAYVGVHKIPPGSIFTMSSTHFEFNIRSFSTNFFTPVYLPSDTDKETYLRNSVENLCNRLRWYLHRGISINTHLTGGKDSRMILALLMGSSSIDRIGKIVTVGEEDNGDVIVARKLVASLGLKHKHDVSTGSKKKTTPTLQEIAHRFYLSANRYDGQLTPFDGSGKPKSLLPSHSNLMGGGGEIYRSKLNIDTRDKYEIFQKLKNYFCPFDKLNILTKDGLQWQEKFIQNEVDHYLSQHILNAEMKFYIDQRLSNWGNGHMNNGAGTSIPLLLDIDLARLAASHKNLGEEVHFGIIRYACPELLNEPFLNQRWGGSTRLKASLLGVDLDPITVPVAKNFPWQFDCYLKLRNPCLDNLLDNFEGFSPWISRDKILNLRKTDVYTKKYNSADIKMVFGLSMAANQLAGDNLYLPDNYKSPSAVEGPLLNKTASRVFSNGWPKEEVASEFLPAVNLAKQLTRY